METSDSKISKASIVVTALGCYVLFNVFFAVFEIIFSRYAAYLQFNLNTEAILTLITRGQYVVIPLVILSTVIIHFSRMKAILTVFVLLVSFIFWLAMSSGGDIGYLILSLLSLRNQILLIMFCIALFALVFRWIDRHKTLRFKTVLLLFLIIFTTLVGIAGVVKAKSISNPNKCNGSTEYRRNCLLSVAQKTNNLDLCVKSSSLSAFQVLKQSNLYGPDFISCVNLVWSKLTTAGSIECGNFSDPRAQDICIYRTALASKNSVACNQFNNNEMKNSCLEEISTMTGVENISCGGITNVFQEAKCFIGAAIRLGDISLCQKITYPKDMEGFRSGRVNQCISVVARTNKQISLCNEIDSESSNTKQECLASVQNNSAPCEAILSTDGKAFCLNQAARDNGNLNICNASADKWRCYMDIAVIKNDASICELILNSSFKKGCESSLKNPRSTLDYVPII